MFDYVGLCLMLCWIMLDVGHYVGCSLCITISLLPVPAMLLYYKNIIVTSKFRTSFDGLAYLLALYVDYV